MKRLCLFLLLVLLGVSWAAAQTAGYSTKFKLSGRNFADSIEIEYDEGRVFVPVVVGGRTRRFLLDTGSAQAVVYDDDLPQGCKPLGTIRSLDALGQASSVPMVQLPPVVLGTMSITGLRATVHPRPPMHQRIDGVLGFDLVCKGLLMKIDAARRLLVLTDRKKHFAREPQGSVVAYEVLPYRHTPYVVVTPFAGFTEQVLLDTGSPFLYRMNHDSFVQALPFCLAQNPAQVLDTLQGSFSHGLHGPEPAAAVVRLRLDSLLLGGHAFRSLPVQTTQGLSHLGGPLLQHGTLLFMPHRRRLSFVPYGQEPAAQDQ